jgi:hypothetical protein
LTPPTKDEENFRELLTIAARLRAPESLFLHHSPFGPAKRFFMETI